MIVRSNLTSFFSKILSFISSNKTLFIIFTIGITLRITLLSFVPGMGAVNQDEAFAGYEAYSLIHHGVDSHGYAFPAYFVSWGSGMNVLESYLMIPFVKVLGLRVSAIRLPIALLSIASLFAFYGIVKRIFSKKYSILATFIFSILPWNFIVSRWAVESNLAPFLLLISQYFLIRSTEKIYFIIPSFICYGLCFYAYSCFWPVLPILILGSLLYLLIKKKIKITRHFAVGAILFLIICTPLALFVGVNYGFIPEIKTSVFSVPKMPTFRSGEFGFSLKNIIHSAKIVLLQRDDSVWNTPRRYGWYFHFMTPLWIIGLLVFVARQIKKKKESSNFIVVLVFLQLLCAFLLGAITDTNSTRIGIIHVPIIFFGIYGIHAICRAISERVAKNNVELTFNRTIAATTVFFAFCGSLFLAYYYSSYNLDVAYKNDLDQKKALEYILVNNTSDRDVHLLTGVQVSKILFYDFSLPTLDESGKVTESSVCGSRDLCYSRAGNYFYEDLSNITPDVVPGDYYLCNHNDAKCFKLLSNDKIGHKIIGEYVILSTSITKD